MGESHPRRRTAAAAPCSASRTAIFMTAQIDSIFPPHHQELHRPPLRRVQLIPGRGHGHTILPLVEASTGVRGQSPVKLTGPSTDVSMDISTGISPDVSTNWTRPKTLLNKVQDPFRERVRHAKLVSFVAVVAILLEHQCLYLEEFISTQYVAGKLQEIIYLLLSTLYPPNLDK